MMRKLLKGSIFLIAVGTVGYFVLKGVAPPTAKASQPSDCKRISFEKSSFTQCIATPGKHKIETKVTGSDGVIYRGFPKLARDIPTKNISFAVNGGMYDSKSRPIGYYVENGERLYKLNEKDGEGNFHLKPNGVFFGTGDKWQVLASEEFADTISKRPDFGTQSGPMLVIDRQFHPKFSEDGVSRKIRNAVGVDAQGRAHFVIAEEPVSFGKMARMMRDHAKTPNALFLDGTVSALWRPDTGRMDDNYPLGPLIVVSRITKENSQ